MRLKSNRSKKFTIELLEKFITSRPQGTSFRSIEAYHYTLDCFVDYPATAQGITAYLKTLTCNNPVKLNFIPVLEHFVIGFIRMVILPLTQSNRYLRQE